MYYCCEDCFENKAIKEFIRQKNESSGECGYCGTNNTTLISLQTLKEYLCICINKAYEDRDLKYTSYIQYNLFYRLCISLPLDKDIYTVSLNVLKHDSVLHSQYKDIVVDLQNRMDEMLEDANIIDSLIKFDEKQLEFIKDYTKKNNIPIK